MCIKSCTSYWYFVWHHNEAKIELQHVLDKIANQEKNKTHIKINIMTNVKKFLLLTNKCKNFNNLKNISIIKIKEIKHDKK